MTYSKQAKDTLFVCITSTIRPDLLRLTLESFHTGLFCKFGGVRLLANLDPLYCPSSQQRQSCIDLIRRFNTIEDPIIFQPERADFNVAVKTLWRSVIPFSRQAGFFFHLEDDWFLAQQVTPDRVLALLEEEGAASVRLFLRPVKGDIRDTSFSLNPSFINTMAAEGAIKFWDDGVDPEKLIGSLGLGRTRVYRPNNAFFPCVIDTGIYWRKRVGINKRYLLSDGRIKSVWLKKGGSFGLQTLTVIRYKVKYEMLWAVLNVWQFMRILSVKLRKVR